MSFSSRRGKHSFSIRDASATSDIFDDDGWVVSSSSIRRKNASIIKVDAVEDDDFDDDVFFVVVVVSPFASFPSSTVVVVDLVVLLLALVVLEVVLVMVVVVFFIVRDERETQLKCGTKDAPFLGGKEQDQKKSFRVSLFFFFFLRAEFPFEALAQEDTRPSFRHLHECVLLLDGGSIWCGLFVLCTIEYLPLSLLFSFFSFSLLSGVVS